MCVMYIVVLKAFTHFLLGFSIHFIGWVGPRTRLDGTEKRKISRLCRDVNPRPATT